MSVTEVHTDGLKGYLSSFTHYKLVDKEEYQKTCKPFVAAENAIQEVSNYSMHRGYYYPDSVELTWEAERAIGPLECDPVRSKILADKAKEIAMNEGAKALGHDLSGTYISDISGSHPVITMLIDKSNGALEPRLFVKQIDNKIMGTDSSGKAILMGSRPEELLEDIVKFDFSYQEISNTRISGEWEVINNGSTLKGTWRDPASETSGTWDLYQITNWKKAILVKNYAKHEDKYFSRKPAVEIEWDKIEKILMSEKDRDWAACVVVGGVIPICGEW